MLEQSACEATSAARRFWQTWRIPPPPLESKQDQHVIIEGALADILKIDVHQTAVGFVKDTKRQVLIMYLSPNANRFYALPIEAFGSSPAF